MTCCRIGVGTCRSRSPLTVGTYKHILDKVGGARLLPCVSNGRFTQSGVVAHEMRGPPNHRLAVKFSVRIRETALRCVTWAWSLGFKTVDSYI